MAVAILALTSVGFAGTEPCPPQQIAKLTANDGASGDAFARSVALNAGVAVIGAYADDGDSGSAYIYEQQAGGTWQQFAKLTADDGAGGDRFGYSVALDAGVAVIGAYADDGESGSAYVYEQQPGGTWQQIAKLTADDGASGDYFGSSVSIDAGVAVIGAYWDDAPGHDSGSAYVFEQQADGTWQQAAKLTADDGTGEDWFGYSVSNSGGVAVIGAPRADAPDSDSGSAYVYEQQWDGTWQQTAKLTADDGASSDYFGDSVAIDAGVAVIGAYGDDDNGPSSGSAYVFEQQTNGSWQQVAKLTADDAVSGDYFGYSVALDGDVAVIGAEHDDDNGASSGSAYVYEQQAGGTWQQIAKLTADDGGSYNYFGISAALDAGVAVIGAYGWNGDHTGSAYVFDLLTIDCNNNGVCDTDDLFDGTSADCNGNGIPDECDTANGTSYDCDGDQVPDECEPDCDGDGLIDDCDSEPDQDNNGVPDNCDPDCNNNGIADGVETLFGWANDCDGDTVPDDCQLADGSATDCDGDGTLDHCQVTADPNLDCDENGILDSCDVETALALAQVAKLTADEGVSNDLFGHSVAVDAGVSVIGAYADGEGSGSAYIYEQQADGTWQQTAKLTADDGAEGDNFGYSVATSDGVTVVGSINGNSAYVYEQQGDGAWQQIVKLTANDAVSPIAFGCSVATSGDVAVVGAYGDDDNGSYSGSAYVYEQQPGGTWQQTAKLTADDGASNDSFGVSVAISDGVVVIGANGGTGSAYVYEQQADGTWPQIAKLTEDDQGDAQFGHSVATSSGVVVIGALYDNDNNSGSAYIFEQRVDGTWQQTAKLTADDGASNDQFGKSVAASNGVAVIGAFLDDDNGESSGSAYVYKQLWDGTWQQIAKLTADDAASGDNFGVSVALDAGVVVIGARYGGADSAGNGAGSAYVFEPFSQLDCDANGLIDDCEIEDEPSLDCDLDGILDSCAFADGSVGDCNENGIPDSCEFDDLTLDCDLDGVLDSCAIADGSASDCNENGVPDSCDFDDPTLDCDLDGVLDSCAIADGSADDCNENGVPDSCDIAGGGDADGDGYLDECECDGDIAGPGGPLSDGVINIEDLLAVIGYWGSSIPAGDVDGDGIVGINDLLAVIGAWGPCE